MDSPSSINDISKGVSGILLNVFQLDGQKTAVMFLRYSKHSIASSLTSQSEGLTEHSSTSLVRQRTSK